MKNGSPFLRMLLTADYSNPCAEKRLKPSDRPVRPDLADPRRSKNFPRATETHCCVDNLVIPCYLSHYSLVSACVRTYSGED